MNSFNANSAADYSGAAGEANGQPPRKSTREVDTDNWWCQPSTSRGTGGQQPDGQHSSGRTGPSGSSDRQFVTARQVLDSSSPSKRRREDDSATGQAGGSNNSMAKTTSSPDRPGLLTVR